MAWTPKLTCVVVKETDVAVLMGRYRDRHGGVVDHTVDLVAATQVCKQ